MPSTVTQFCIVVCSHGDGRCDSSDRHVEGRGEEDQGTVGETRAANERPRGRSE